MAAAIRRLSRSTSIGKPIATPYLKVCRTAEKQFPQFHWDGSAWIKGKPNGPKIPYRLPELLAASVGTTIYFCEGEKDADYVAKLGFVATSASEGAKAKWEPALTAWFKNRRIVILTDADAPGREHAQKVARALHPVASSVKVVDLYPDRSDGSDVCDWLESDTTGVKLIEVVNNAPLWEPNDDADKAATTPKQGDNPVSLVAELAKLPASIRRRRNRKRRKTAQCKRVL